MVDSQLATFSIRAAEQKMLSTRVLFLVLLASSVGIAGGRAIVMSKREVRLIRFWAALRFAAVNSWAF